MRYGDHNVDVQFRTPTGTYKTVQTVVTDSSGSVSTYLTDNAIGVWRLYYGGTSTAGTTAAVGDSVSVY